MSTSGDLPSRTDVTDVTDKCKISVMISWFVREVYNELTKPVLYNSIGPGEGERG